MSKLYTETQVKAAIIAFVVNKYELTHENLDKIVDFIIPTELPTDEEIKEEADSYHGLESYNITFIQGAKWMRDKIKGGTNE